MWFPLAKPGLLLSAAAAMLLPAAAQQMLVSTSLNTCQDNSRFTASLFNVVFTPNNNSASVDIVAVSSIEGNVVFDVQIAAYGYRIIRKTVDPCDSGLAGLCPMRAGKIPLQFNLPVSPSAVSQIPSIAYTFPDLDATVRVFINMTSGTQAGQSVACVEAEISNGKTVDLLGVKWATAIVAGLALASSAVVSGLGHSNAASHIAANALSLFSYFQSVAMVGLTAIPLPPIVQSWTQDFQWTMGIIHVEFMQSIFTWYQRATGGTPSTLFDSLTTVSVQVEKRSLPALPALLASPLGPMAGGLFRRAVAMMPARRSAAAAAAAGARALTSPLVRRGNIQLSTGSFLVYGIQRVAFRAGIESTNLFMTGLTFFCIFVAMTVLGVAAFKGLCELAVRNRWMKSETFLDFRNGWFTVLKGILFRMTLIGYPQMTILCLWEFTQVDSPAEVVLAVFFFFGMTITLGWAASKVIRIARRSVAMHQNPAYILFSDPQALNKWGFLYVQFRASAYYFIVPVLGYTLVKGMFVALSQGSGTIQAIAFIILEAGALIAASVLRPWMDKSTNSINISICVINFLNAIFLLIFTDVFNQPAIVTGVVGVVLWIANAVFSLVLLIMLIVTTALVLFRKNPDTRYQFMGDDRASFMKSQTQLTTTTELDALAATARGDKGGYKPGLDLDDDNESITSESLRRRTDPSNMALPPSTGNSSYRDAPRSPVDPSMPLVSGGNGNDNGPSTGGRPGPPPPQHQHQHHQYNNTEYQPQVQQHQQQQQPHYLAGQPDNVMRSPSPFGQSSSYRQQHSGSPSGFRVQNNPSPWQRGAGYDH